MGLPPDLFRVEVGFGGESEGRMQIINSWMVTRTSHSASAAERAGVREAKRAPVREKCPRARDPILVYRQGLNLI